MNLTAALLTGLILSVVLMIIMSISLAVAPDMWVGDYPPDIKQKYGPMSARAARLRPYIAAVFFLAVVAIPLLGLFALKARVGAVPFLSALAFSGIALLVFNAFDLLILDWLLFCTIRPPWIVLPGTEGLAGYRDYRFHFIGFLKGLGFCALGALLVSGLWLAIQALVP
jgi:hypothetical protein